MSTVKDRTSVYNNSIDTEAPLSQSDVLRRESTPTVEAMQAFEHAEQFTSASFAVATTHENNEGDSLRCTHDDALKPCRIAPPPPPPLQHTTAACQQPDIRRDSITTEQQQQWTTDHGDFFAHQKKFEKTKNIFVIGKAGFTPIKRESLYSKNISKKT